MKNRMIEENRELSEVERRLKASFERNPERHLDRPCTQKEVEDILAYGFLPLARKEGKADTPALANEIPEGVFIAPDMDCGFVRHMRYMPAYWHTHEFFEVLAVLQGSCISTFQGGPQKLVSGDICIQVPGTSHAVSAFADDAILYNILIRRSTFEHTFIGVLDTDTIVSGFFRRAFANVEAIPWLIFHTGEDPVITEDLLRAFEETESTRRYRRQMTDSIMTEFFLHLLERHEKDLQAGNVALRDDGDSIMYILRYMQENCTTVTLHGLAAFFGYSERQIQRIINNATGMTFTENIQKQRMHMAEGLLLKTALPVGDIAEKCGFDSPGNFRRTFRMYFGDTPGRYRAQHSSG